MATPTKTRNPMADHRDGFAAIAARSMETPRGALGGLVLAPPTPVPARVLPLTKKPKGFAIPAPMATAAQLAKELARLRRVHAPFLADRAPALPSLRPRLAVTTCAWRIEDAADRADPLRPLRGDGDWQPVTLPHYGEPLGPAATWYRHAFAAPAALRASDCVKLVLRGVDYRCRVWLNGVFIGAHEGFFAPFELDTAGLLRARDNVLAIRVENDGTSSGAGPSNPKSPLGDKIYAATGPGYDEPVRGWHHCPPAMGIYQGVWFEGRAAVHVEDLWVKPGDAGAIEVRVELGTLLRNAMSDGRLQLAVFAQNHAGPGVAWHEPVLPGQLGPGTNWLRFALRIPRPRIWEPDHPHLYQVQVRVLAADGTVIDTAKRQFGLRSFVIRDDGSRKGVIELNGREIRLRGANTMGYEQLDVMRGDLAQLVDDLLLGKACHMNFLRITQRPVQEEIYDHCDRLGILVQTDLPLFGFLRRSQFHEGVRQAGEMERLIRSHPACVLVSWINEPFPASWGLKDWRCLDRNELLSFMDCCAQAVRLHNPDRAIKPIDGDYDPPGPGLPDYHIYTLWYNGHGLPFGDLHQGWFPPGKPDWLHGCGEFGAEGLDPLDLMQRRYPAAWLPQPGEDPAAWTPSRIPDAQSYNMHFLFYDRPQSIAEWVTASQRYQALATRLYTEALRRQARINSLAIHLFIDAWPSGWMKTIMDCERQPKPAFFAYRDALTPVQAHFRADRCQWWAGETAELEAWICNDTPEALIGARLCYALECDGALIAGGECALTIPACTPLCPGRVRLPLPNVTTRTTAIARLALVDARGRVRHGSTMELPLWPHTVTAPVRATAYGTQAKRLLRDIGARRGNQSLVIDGSDWAQQQCSAEAAARSGATVVVLGLPVGTHTIAGEPLEVLPTTLGRTDFASRATGHPLVAGFAADDFRFWHRADDGKIVPFIDRALRVAPGWAGILRTGAGQFWGGPGLSECWACAEKSVGSGHIRLCFIDLSGRLATNPAAAVFARRLLTE